MSEILSQIREDALAAEYSLNATSPFEKYQADILGYAHDVLGVTLWDTQQEICQRILTPPYKVLCTACHSVGKTFLAAVLVSWFYDCFAKGAGITTAPTARDVRRLLWREIRLQRQDKALGGFVGHSAPLLRSGDDHYVEGFTAEKGESFQGRHQEYMLFIFDECIGIEGTYWDTTKSMFVPDGKHFWFAIGNPTDTSSQAYVEDKSTDLQGNPSWHRVSMDARDHPNLRAGLVKESLPYPSAITVSQFEQFIADWCEPIPDEEVTEIDLQWPPQSGPWYRPGPEMESRGLGRWPSAGTYGVWSEALWKRALLRQDTPILSDMLLPEIGCDVARFGEDYTTIHTRVGNVSLAHERHNGWEYDQTAGRLKELCRELAHWSNVRRDASARPIQPEEIAVKVDDSGQGGNVMSHAGGFRFLPVNSAHVAIHEDKYPNVRSELWFLTALRAKRRELDLSRLDRKTQERLRQQAMAPLWKLDAKGRRQVEKKEETKKRLKSSSPDDMDGVNLAYYAVSAESAQRVDTKKSASQKKTRNPYGKR